jgi:succinyl-diaminopimelate desuccinylase
MDTIELSSKLIKFKSITPNSSGSLEFVKSILEREDFKCRLLEFGKDKIKNLYASFKGGDGPVICFAGHTDVVPPGDINKWKTDPFKPVIKNGKLYGRGSSDMKTAIASFLVASFRFLKKNQFSFNGTLSFLLTADEEGDAEYGTKSVVRWLKKNKKKIDYCLVGEPTNPEILGEMVKIGRRGSINFVLDVFGVQGHVAYPEKAKNPIDKIMMICDELKKPFDKGSRTFQPTKLVITSIDVSNNVTNLIPGKAKVRFNVRFNDLFKSCDIIKIVNKRIKLDKRYYKLNFKVSGESFYNYSKKLTNAIIKSVRKITKKNPELSTSGGTSDARFISEICPVVEFGSIGKTMHQTNEMVELKNIDKLTEIYFYFLENIFND